MKKGISITLITILLAAVLLPTGGCNHNKLPETILDSTENSTVPFENNREKIYDTIRDMVTDAELIVVGTIIDRYTITFVEKSNGSNTELVKTYSILRTEKVIKGDSANEIPVCQSGTVDWGEEPGNPIFEIGEQCFLFLYKENDTFRLLDSVSRFRIENGQVSSMEHVLPEGSVQIPDTISFRKVGLEEFVYRVEAPMPGDKKISPLVPDSEVIIEMSMAQAGEDRFDILAVYENREITWLTQYGLNMLTGKKPPIRVWRMGIISEDEIDALLELFQNDSFSSLDRHYETGVKETEKTRADSLLPIWDTTFTFRFFYSGISKVITIENYPAADDGKVSTDLPYPLSEILVALRDLGESRTEKIFSAEEHLHVTIEKPPEK